MELFEIINGVVYPSTHALLIEPFKTIWETDDSKGRSRAMKVFRYVELMCSPKKSNPYFGYSELVRPSKVKKEVFNDENYQDTSFMIAAIVKFKELLASSSPSYDLLNSAFIAKDDLVDFLKDTKKRLAERSQSGAMIFKPKDLTNALKDVGDVTRTLEAAREKVGEELKEASKTRGQRVIGRYER